MKHLGMVLDREFLSASPFEGQSTAIPESGQLLQHGRTVFDNRLYPDSNRASHLKA
jgi:hypothetical protein